MKVSFLKWIGVCIILVLWEHEIFAQKQKLIDSLEVLLPSVKDTQRVKILNQLCWEFRNDDFKKALAYIGESVTLAEKIKYNEGLAEGLNFTGTIHRKLGNYDKAMEFFFRCLRLAEQFKLKEQNAYAYNNIGEIYTIQSDFENAEKYIQRALIIFQEIKDKKGIAYCFIRLGETMQSQKKLNEALIYFLKCVEIREEINDKRGLAVIYTSIGEIYRLEKKFNIAIEYTLKGLKMRADNDKTGTAQSLSGIAKIYQNSKQTQKAIEYSNQSIELAKKINSKKIIQESAQILADAYADLKNYPKAYQFEKLSAEMGDSLFHEENNRVMMNLRESYETEKKEAEISLLTTNKKMQEETIRLQREDARLKTMLIYIFIAGFAIFLVLSVVIFIGLQKQKKQKSIIIAEQQKSEQLLLNILPHDVATELKEKGITEVRHFKQTSVLFADIKGFSAMATRVSPQTLIKELDYCFGKFDDIIEKHGLERIKTIGDCYMCAAGVPQVNPAHAVDICLSALEIQFWMQEEHNLRVGKGDSYWSIRLGINSGDLVAGVIGKTKFAYDIWGNTVNTAARLESAGDIGKVLISDNTYSDIKDFFDCIHKGKIEVKNIGLVDTYFVEQIKPELSKLGLGKEPNEEFWELRKSKFGKKSNNNLESIEV